MKRKFARTSFIAIIGLALLGYAEISRADVFYTDDFSGTISLSKTMTMPSGQTFKTVVYNGQVVFDETTVAGFTPGFQTYPTFIADGGSFSLTLELPSLNVTLSPPTDTPAGDPWPVLVVDLNKPVGFNFTLAGDGVTLTVQAPSATPAPGTSTTMWTGVTNNVTFALGTHPGVAGSTVPTFTFKSASVPEPGNLALICVGALIVALPQVRRRMAVAI